MPSPSTLLSCQSLAKSYGTRPLFRNITFGIAEGERVGLIGPNGSGKSTLLKILAGQEKPDEGAVSRRSGLVVGYVSQEDVFAPGATVTSTLVDAVAGTGLAADPDELDRRITRLLERLSFADPDQATDTLSGGWRKRLSLAREMVRAPDLLLLDEPTNHLDLEGVLWLERFLTAESDFAYLVVSHDRTFLENVARRTVELNTLYADGYLSVDGSYSEFLVRREDYYAAQQNRQAALETVLKREVEWLRRGAQARSTKAKGRIEAAGQLMQDVATLKQRNAAGAAGGPGIDFTSSGRRTKELLVGKGMAAVRGGRTLFSGLDLLLPRGSKLGLLGPNGSGKTTLLRMLTGEVEPDAGTLRRADQLNVVWFDQNREQLDRDTSLKDSLSPNGDTVTYRDSSMHISAWAKRFGFKADQMNTPIRYLSGGEQARILIARLMLRPADILILDEPTNDLDIPTLEVLEENLQDFPGAMVLVTHDRYLLDTISTEILALDGAGDARFFTSYEQWETWYEAQNAPAAAAPAKAGATATAPVLAPARSGLSSAERRELQQMEGKIEKAEARVVELDAQMVHSTVATDAAKLQETWTALEQAKVEVERLYARWEDLEARQNRPA